jgi:hypothetical protein
MSNIIPEIDFIDELVAELGFGGLVLLLVAGVLLWQAIYQETAFERGFFVLIGLGLVSYAFAADLWLPILGTVALGGLLVFLSIPFAIMAIREAGKR